MKEQIAVIGVGSHNKTTLADLLKEIKCEDENKTTVKEIDEETKNTKDMVCDCINHTLHNNVLFPNI